MRGKDGDSVHSRLPFRITPAYAGKRIYHKKCDLMGGDHPRLCGEKGDPFRLSQAVSGSPPPMRGKAEIFQKDVNNYGITPAYAGKSSRSYVLYKFV